MWYFVRKVSPKPDTELAKEAGGAFVNCWIDFREKDGAETLAKFYLGQEEWDCNEIQEAAWVEALDYEDDAEGLQHFLEAQDNSACFVVHQWGLNGEGEE
jgi:hypothetical protein